VGTPQRDLPPDEEGAAGLTAPSSSRAAPRRSPSLTMLYRSKTERVLCPVRFVATHLTQMPADQPLREEDWARVAGPWGVWWS